MKALFLKDCFVLWKQLRLFLVVMLFITALNGSFGNIFIVIWAAMMPYTALAYDERSKWDQLAAMMPYSVRDIVVSKYVLGWVCIAAAAVFAALVQGLLTLLHFPTAAFEPMSNLIGFFGGICALAATLPLMFRFGVEKGRLTMLVIIGVICGGAAALSSITIAVDQTAGGIGGPFGFFMAILPLAALVLTALSIPLSIRCYTRKMR